MIVEENADAAKSLQMLLKFLGHTVETAPDGTLYCLDGLLGLATGSGYLDLGIFLHGVLDLPFTIRVLMNLPHIAIGGFAASLRCAAGRSASRGRSSSSS